MVQLDGPRRELEARGACGVRNLKLRSPMDGRISCITFMNLYWRFWDDVHGFWCMKFME